MMKYIIIIIAIVFVSSLCVAQTGEMHSSILARAGKMFISEQEFLERYELLPGQYRNRRNNTEGSKLVFLYSLVAEKLLAQEALDRHVDQDSGFLSAVGGIKKMLVRDELYQEEVSRKVSIKKSEVLAAAVDARRTLSLSFIYTEDSTDAAFIRTQLKQCRNFNRFRIDTSIAAIRDTATLRWGEAEAPIEKAGFRLKKGDCSPVVKASTGYYILHLDSESPNQTYVDLQPDALSERVESKLRLRKEQARLDEFLGTVLHAKTGFSLPGPFKKVAQTLNALWENSPAGSEQMVTDSLIDVLRRRCSPILNDSMAVVGTSSWTVDQVIARLRGRVFTVDHTHTTGIAPQLNNQLLILIQQELLAEEGLSRKLDERWSVKNELEIWRDQILSKYEEMYIQGSVAVSDSEVFRSLPPGTVLPRVQLRELHTQDPAAMINALSTLSAGTPFEKVVQTYSTDSVSALNGGLTPEFSIDRRSPLGAMAWNMRIGDRNGPVRMGKEYIYFEVVKKDLPSGVSDSSFRSMMMKASASVRSQKQKKMLDTFIARSAQERGYDVFTDRLRLLKVTDVPMMTYRILGFGGRMFAAPFATPQIDWLNVENPNASPLP